jgi:hypothetical protein
VDGQRTTKWRIKVLTKSEADVHRVPHPKIGMIIRGWTSKVIGKLKAELKFRFFFCQFPLAMLISKLNEQ